MKMANYAGCISIAGIAIFLSIVVFLHLVQPGYDPVNQLMSELALGEHGNFMLFAFFGLSLALFSILLGLSKFGSGNELKAPLLLAASCFAGAGIFPLGSSTEIHIVLVMLAFVASGLAMFLLPSSGFSKITKWGRLLSWFLLIAMALSVIAAQLFIPIGIAQRLAAASLISWVLAVSWRLIKA